MKALVRKTDSHNVRSYLWMIGKNKQSLLKQLDDLKDHSCCCGLKNNYDIIVWEDNDIFYNAYDNTVISIDQIKTLM